MKNKANLIILLLCLSWISSQLNAQCIPSEIAIPEEKPAIPNPGLSVQDIENYQKSKAVLTAQSKVFLGREPRPFELFDDWCELLETPAFAGLSQCKEGLSHHDAQLFLVRFLKNNPVAGSKMVNGIYLEVFGREPTPEERWGWQTKIHNGNAWFVNIKSAVITSINKTNQLERALMISRAYFNAFARTPKTNELNFWLSRNDTYSQVKEAHRNWLYSSSSGDELPNTIRRGIAIEKKIQPTTEALKNIVAPDKLKYIISIWKEKRSLYEDYVCK